MGSHGRLSCHIGTGGIRQSISAASWSFMTKHHGLTSQLTQHSSVSICLTADSSSMATCGVHGLGHRNVQGMGAEGGSAAC